MPSSGTCLEPGAHLKRKLGGDGKQERRVHLHLQVHEYGMETVQRKVKLRGEWITARPGAAAVTASEYTEEERWSAIPTASANHACYWAGFGEAVGTP